MNCRSCNTRLSSRSQACPNCGHTERLAKFLDSDAESVSPEDSGSSLGPLSPSSALASAEQGHADIDLDEEVELPLEKTVGKKRSADAATSPRAGRKTSKKVGKRAAQPEQRKARKPERNANAASRPAAKREAKKRAPVRESAVFVPMVPAQIRHAICEGPELLEPGLSIYNDEDGNEVGAQFETEVGEIDLLARNAAGEFVVVMVVEGEAGQEVVPDALLRMGYVSKHVPGAANAGVRGMVLLEGVSDGLGYAAAAVSDRIDFRTWRLQLSFEPLPD